MTKTEEGNNEIMNLTRVGSTVILCLCYCHMISATLPKGKWRLISLLPIFSIFSILPLHTSSTFFTSLTAFLLTWLSNFKLLLFAFDHGPFASPISLPLFIATVALPFRLKPANAPKRPNKLLPLFFSTEIPIFVVLVSILYDRKDNIHPNIVLLAYGCVIFLMVDIVIELTSSFVRVVFGLDVEPPSHEPYLATSLQEFWGRRWNLTVNGLLRETVFRPVLGVLGRGWGALPAVMATFLVSGLMHELGFWYVIRGRPSWEMTMFFVVQGVGVVVEFGVKAALRERVGGLPWFVSGPMTVGFVVGTGFWLFFPPLTRNGVDVKLFGELGYLGEVVKGWVVTFLDFVLN